jgi:hypothetical protein
MLDAEDAGCFVMMPGFGGFLLRSERISDLAKAVGSDSQVVILKTCGDSRGSRYLVHDATIGSLAPADDELELDRYEFPRFNAPTIRLGGHPQEALHGGFGPVGPVTAAIATSAAPQPAARPPIAREQQQKGPAQSGAPGDSEFEREVSNLASFFPNLDRETVREALIDAKGNVELAGTDLLTKGTP